MGGREGCERLRLFLFFDIFVFCIYIIEDIFFYFFYKFQDFLLLFWITREVIIDATDYEYAESGFKNSIEFFTRLLFVIKVVHNHLLIFYLCFFYKNEQEFYMFV